MKRKEDKIKSGRPSSISKELIDKICFRIENEARGLKWICDSDPNFPDFRTVFNWMKSDTELGKYLLDKYARAREGQADTIADTMLDIVFEPSKHLVAAQDKRTQLDALKWIASKLKPKKYGDKVEVDQKITGDVKVTLNLNK